VPVEDHDGLSRGGDGHRDERRYIAARRLRERVEPRPQFTSVLPPEQRFPVIDEERGLVFGVTLLHYLKTPNQSVMYV